MTTPPEMLERTLAAHGDMLYRMALLLGGDDRRAEALLRAAVAGLLAAGPAAPADEPALLARLAAAARQQVEPRQERRPPRRPPADLPALYRSALGLPLDQRLALGLALLAGYDQARAALVAGQDEPAARAALIDAVRALAPVAGTSLTDRVSGETCPDVRAALIDPTGRQRHSSAVRGHLSACGPCRSFDHTWGEVTQAIEAALRDVLRERRLPAPLAARLAALARPARRLLSPSLRFAIPPLAVLALVAFLVLPGFTRRAVTVVDADAVPPADPRALVALAIDRYGRPPERGAAIWHGRYETLWYFDDTTVAPLHADIWLDRDNPARHRIQIAHAGGGAPYEQQIGDGDDLLHYALDASYVPSLYGDVATRARENRPLLLTMQLGPDEQRRALAERLSSGPWGIPPFYLRQAEQASDLRALGRLSEGGRTVQVISFSGFSPLGLPADAPGATAERVTVMLAVDSEDGRLRSATEISGPVGGTQVSRVTWRLIEEQMLAAAQAAPAFEISRAWNGLGEFPDRARHLPADLAMPALPRSAAADPAAALSDWNAELWLPASPPPGVDRAVLLWPAQDISGGNSPDGLLYLGPDRRLVITYNASGGRGGEPERVGDWDMWLTPGRGRSYTVALRRVPGVSPALPGSSPNDGISIVAQGFSRAELTAVVEGFGPLDLDSLAAQDRLFVYEGAADPAARAALIEALQAELAAEGVRYVRAEQYSRQNPNIAAVDTPDPYHRPPYEGRPERTVVETWLAPGLAASGGQVLVRESDLAGAELSREHWTDGAAWFYYPAAGYLTRHEARMTPMYERLSHEGRAALEALLQSREGMTMLRFPDGRRVVRTTQEALESSRYSWVVQSETGSPYAADIAPLTLATEVELGADGRLAGFRLIGEDSRGGATELITYRVVERSAVAQADIPRELGGALPEARYTIDWVGQSPRNSILATTTLTGGLALADFPLYKLPDEQGATPRFEFVPPGQISIAEDYEDITANVVGYGAGYRVVYPLVEPDSSAPLVDLRLTQGPAEAMKAFLGGNYARPWFESFQERMTVAGEEREVWVARGRERGYVFVDMGETLLIAEAPIRWFDANIRPTLAQITRA